MIGTKVVLLGIGPQYLSDLLSYESGHSLRSEASEFHIQNRLLLGTEHFPILHLLCGTLSLLKFETVPPSEALKINYRLNVLGSIYVFGLIVIFYMYLCKVPVNNTGAL